MSSFEREERDVEQADDDAPKTLEEALAALEQARERARELTEQNEQLTTRVGELEPLAAEVEDLRGKVTEADRLEAAREYLRENKLPEDRARALAALAKHQDGADPREAFKSAIAANRFLGTPEGPARPSKLPSDEHGSRGRSGPDGTGKFRVTSAQLNDSHWMARNMEAIAKASEEGNFEIAD